MALTAWKSCSIAEEPRHDFCGWEQSWYFLGFLMLNSIHRSQSVAITRLQLISELIKVLPLAVSEQCAHCPKLCRSVQLARVFHQIIQQAQNRVLHDHVVDFKVIEC